MATTAGLRRNLVPSTPRVISPSPTPSEAGSNSDYFAPTTRSAAKKSRKAVVQEADDSERARSRSRSRDRSLRARRLSGLTTLDGSGSREKEMKVAPKQPNLHKNGVHGAANGLANGLLNGAENGHLSPMSAAPKSYWRSLSRSPSPLGLIPIHREWRSFVHRHEIPRKVLHVSIGFLVLFLYTQGVQISSIHPILLSFLIPIAATDLLRHSWPSFNALYIRCFGALMRESEAHEKYNGVIWYLLGAWGVMRFCPKDVAGMSVILLSWCDTAASTVGRAYGRYTPRIRKGKSLAGTLAAMVVGMLTALAFWGYIGPRYERLGLADNTGENAFAFQGVLRLPESVASAMAWPAGQAQINGSLALVVLSVVAGMVASASEAVDLFGWDDNVTIPLLCGIGLWGFLKIFGDA